MGVSNKIISTLNFISILCSILILSSGLYLSSKPDYQCIHTLRYPILILGTLTLLISITGFIGACFNKSGLLAFHLFCMSILIVLLLIILVFAFVVTKPSGAYSVGYGFDEYRLNGFNKWLRERVENGGNWEKIKGCVVESRVCGKLSQDYFVAPEFFASRLSPLQSGCCKPPTVCGYNYVSPTVWINPVNPAADPDCPLWNNDPAQLCYKCDSCKAGLLGNLRQEWRRVNVFLMIAVVVLIFIYVIGCSAFRNAQTEDLFRRYKRGWA